ncbi:NAD(P)/FAD-dependent oxidoreductase [Pseudomonas saudiphocaensis]|uniref:FAD-dependent pyridine nucleotide-disulfide oxidoreductase n=1 Tax=Pseudomonas saudiphocaensis TaxID=1499686 RepID=A0A078LSG8_9PSED|nr:FAD-dependent oxidoreductase [Pseudomonas saudiphocaensis]CDZ94109.1 FAD-dependent pyridine nucleotide-disulfide oxidoreductase [Pseudomonas saudiphocaensis]
MSGKRVLIVGAGHAGGRVAQHLIALDEHCQVILVGEEAYAPYERPALSKDVLLGKQSSDELTLGPVGFWSETTRLQRVVGRVVELDRIARSVTLSDGSQIAFDELVIATGGAARTLDIRGGDLPGLHVLRTIPDCHQLAEALQGAESIAIIGAGVIGMEVAASATQLGLKVTVLDVGDRVMRRCLPPDASAWLRQLHLDAGVSLESSVRPQAIAEVNGQYAIQAKREDGSKVQVWADQMLVAVGIECEVHFAQAAGIQCDNGIVVDEFCRSPSEPWCYAVGDVANTFSPFYGRHMRQETWRNAENQARAVALQITGKSEPYHEIPWMWSDQFGHNIQVVGTIEGFDQQVLRGNPAEHQATWLLLKEGRVVGGVMINQAKDRKPLEALINSRALIDRELLADSNLTLKKLAA